MKKLFFFLALLLPIGAWADEVLIANQDWTAAGGFLPEGTGATSTLTADGLAIYNPKVQTDAYKPQTLIGGGELILKTDHYYKVRLTVKVPSNGKYVVCLGTWASSQGYEIQATASDDFQEFEVEFNEYPYNLTEAHILFQSGFVKGTTVVQNVKVLDVTSDETLLIEKNWNSPFWFADEGSGATCEMVADGVAITNPKVQSEHYAPQTEVLQGTKLQENHTYKVIVEAKIPSNGELQINMGNGDYNEQYSVPVTANKDFQNIEVMFNDFPETLDNVGVLFQNGRIKGTSIVRNVQIIDLGNIPVPLKYRYNPDEETATVIKDPDRNYKGEVVIPPIVEHNDIIYTVTELSEDAFHSCPKLISVTIPATVTKISGSPFGNCPSLTQIIVDPANTVYDSRNNCNGIIEKATNTLVFGCKTTVIPNGITRIGDFAFSGCTDLKNINIPSTVKEIGSDAFSWCISLESLNLPASLETIECYAFNFSNLKSITLPASLTSLGHEAFRNCEELTSVTLPDNLEEIPDSCFKYCAKLESIDLKNVKKIGGGAFASTGITNLVLPASVKEVCNDAFSGCPIATVDLGQVEKIGDCAFIGTAIEELTVPATLTEMGTDLGIETFSWNGAMKKVVFEDGCTKVFDTMFHGNENLSEVFLPYTITEIQPRAFQSCKSLTRITIPERVEKVGEQAFNLCDALTEVTVESPVPPVLDGTEAISNRAKATLNVPRGSRTAYEAAEYWKEFGMIVNVLAEENWGGPYLFLDNGVGATYKMTAEGLSITNPKVQDEVWTPQTIVIQNVRLQQNHSYKVIVNAKIPSAGKLQLNLSNWGTDWNKNISVNASNDFQDFEFLYEDCPYYTESGFLFFQNGCIKGTSVVRNVQILDITDGEEVIAEKNWASPYWFADEGTGATFTMTDEGLAIKNPKVQNEAWTPQTMILKDASLQKNHTYKVIVNAKIPSDGDLQMQLGSWASDVYEHQCIAVNASSDFQDLEFIYRDFPADAEGAFVVFQNGFIAGTSIVRSVRILDMGDVRAELAYNYNDEDHTAEVIKNDNGKYKGDVTIPATVSHNGKDYTVTSISENAFLDCTTLTSISIPATVTKLYGSSFINCAGLQEITVDPANTVYDSRGNSNAIFHTATNKLSVGCVNTVIPEGTTRIGDDAFWGRWGLEHINLPNTVKEIGMHAFAFCFLKEITLPEGVEKIETEAFWSTDLASVTLPASLKTLEDGIFMECTQLTKVTVHNQSPLAISDGEIFSNRANATLYVPAGSKKAYKAASIWKEFKGIVEAEHNSVYSYDLTAYLGTSTEMEINLENWDPFTAYQFDLVLPQGITLEKDASGNIQFTKGKRYAGSRSISVTPRENNTYRIVSASMKNEVISGNDGALLTVYLVASETMAKSTYQAEIKNVIMTTPAEKQINFDPTTVAITTKGLLLGDSNDDESVNVTDIVATVNSILGRPSDKFNSTAADIDRNHVVDIFDVYQGLKLIKNGTRMAARTRAGDTSGDKLTIKDFSILSGMTKQLQVELTNSTAYAGFQFDLVLPEGITVTGYSANASRISEEISVDMEKTEGVYRFIGSGLGAEEISGNSGTILNITVKADENLKGRYQKGYLRDVKLSTAEGTGTTIEETAFNITDETSGDLNKNGKLDAADIKAIAELIMKGEYKAKADVNGDSKVNAADIVVVTNEINKK